MNRFCDMILHLVFAFAYRSKNLISPLVFLSCFAVSSQRERFVSIFFCMKKRRDGYLLICFVGMSHCSIPALYVIKTG